MKRLVTVREYAWLTTSEVETSSLDYGQVSSSAFDWLCKLSSSFNSGAALTQIKDQSWLQLDNYVGVVETPCGTQLEILPKHFVEGDCIEESRALLLKMMRTAFDLPTRGVGEAHLQLFNAPISEWVMHQFLEAFDHLVKRGVRFEYKRVEEEARVLRGQLNLSEQIRQRPERQHHFQIRHDIFSPDRPENRLLKLALERVCKATQTPSNWRLAHELRSLLAEIPASDDVKSDFANWRSDRLMSHYRCVRPWCELILNQQMPTAVAGEWKGMSLLFPMEKLFERYVAACLGRSLATDAEMTRPSNQYLCSHDGGPMFWLEPDMMIESGKLRWILDTKWKLIDSSDRKNKYGLKQSDFYQLFAYGNTYLRNNEDGRLVLIYPKRALFDKPLPVFSFSEHLVLWVLPFDLETGRLENFALCGLPLTTA
ncbi:restriction endonuclease [Bradyrhizobium sp. CCBAU 45394]|uniref:McrC family protein n=1 Tax=Bradyrhizobium sp. CCBAU 45394 TaxID=1325087 RepID=UPI0023023BAB|nr:McrC family protein [Bradyrhizobium sp. CCBAU 45394]MDA9391457.1 restriction endonuclease [Bradyrhizobium sp. CCBAU 45394]